MSLELIFGPMFAGKSCELIRRIRMLKVLGRKYMVIKPCIDTRYKVDMIVSHNMEEEKCIILNKMEDIYYHEYDDVSTIFIDEAQFFSDLKEIVIELVEKYNKNVIVAGLIGDSDRKAFGQIIDLIPFCDSNKITSLNALCLHCNDGTIGSFSHCNMRHKDQILVGESNIYNSVCRKHYLQLNNI